MRAFFDVVWGNAHGRWGELRMMRNGSVDQQFFDLNVRANWEVRDAAYHQAMLGWDVYYGVLPREEPSGKAADVFPETSILWADVDAKRIDTIPAGNLRTQKIAALGIINHFPTPPNIIVDSGGGYHCYWLLDRPEELTRAQAVMQWISDQIGGDRVHDAPRILRVPGTLNFKRIPAEDVRLLKLDTSRRYRLADLEGYLPLPKEPRRRRINPDGPREDLPGWLTELIRDGVPQGSRSEQCFRAIIWLLRYGRGYDEVLTTFIANPDGIGSKYEEKGSDGPRWFDATFRAAEAVA